MGRGRAGALVFVLLVGLNPASFTADAEGEAAAGRLGWRDTKTFLLCDLLQLWSKVCIHTGSGDAQT